MPALLSWGPFVIQTSLLAVIAALLLGVLAVRLFAFAYGAPAGIAAEFLQNGCFIALIVWKFGHIVFAPSVIWDRPLALLMMNGGSREAGAAIACAIIYIGANSMRQRFPPPLLLDMIACGAVVSFVAYASLNWTYGSVTTLPWGVVLSDPEILHHPVSVYMAIMGVGCLAAMGLLRKQAGTGNLFRFAALYMGMGLLFVSLFQIPEQQFYLLTAIQWRGLLLAAIGIVSSILNHNKIRKEMKEDDHEANND
ncbi:MAG: hypothetical protein K0Q59_2158 [Paenibacillus sp.]|nr:hypothetical protein [Paenibacillus sp.]